MTQAGVTGSRCCHRRPSCHTCSGEFGNLLSKGHRRRCVPDTHPNDDTQTPRKGGRPLGAQQPPQRRRRPNSALRRAHEGPELQPPARRPGGPAAGSAAGGRHPSAWRRQGGEMPLAGLLSPEMIQQGGKPGAGTGGPCLLGRRPGSQAASAGSRGSCRTTPGSTAARKRTGTPQDGPQDAPLLLQEPTVTGGQEPAPSSSAPKEEAGAATGSRGGDTWGLVRCPRAHGRPPRQPVPVLAPCCCGGAHQPESLLSEGCRPWGRPAGTHHAAPCHLASPATRVCCVVRARRFAERFATRSSSGRRRRGAQATTEKREVAAGSCGPPRSRPRAWGRPRHLPRGKTGHLPPTFTADLRE